METQECQEESGSFPCELTPKDFQTTRGRGRECTGMVWGAVESQASLKHKVHDGKERREGPEMSGRGVWNLSRR